MIVPWRVSSGKQVITSNLCLKKKRLPNAKINIHQNTIAPLKTNEYPLKIDAWKMKCQFKMVPFQGIFVSFRGTPQGTSPYPTQLEKDKTIDSKVPTGSGDVRF